MNIKMLKAVIAGLVISVSGFANAGLINYEMEFTITENVSGSFGGITGGSILLGSVVVDDSFGDNFNFQTASVNASLFYD